MITIRSKPSSMGLASPIVSVATLVLLLFSVSQSFPQQSRLPRQLPSNQIRDTRSNALDEKVYSLTAHESDIRTVLLAFSHQVELNIVVDPEVEGTVTADLKDVTLNEALENLLRPLGYDYSREGNFIRVFLPKIETRHFNINFVITRRVGSRTTTAAQLGSGSFAGAGGGADGGGVGGGVTAGGSGGSGGSSTSVSGTDELDIFRELEIGISSVLYGGSGGVNAFRSDLLPTAINRPGELGESARGFTINRQAGLVTVSDYPENLAKVGKYLEIVQAAIERQVLIQANIVEVVLSEHFRAGINWSIISGNFSSSQTMVPSTGGVFRMGVVGGGFSAILDLLSAQGTVNVLSSPMVTAMNNTPALMRVGTQDVFFSTRAQTDATTGRIVQTVTTPSAITEGVVLSVTPQISNDGFITMNVNPSITERTGTATSPNGDTVPILSVRETDTIIKLREGETIVIAGLIQENERIERTGVPGLKSIPLLGRIFRRTSRELVKTDLAILLTPTIMTPDRIGDVTREELEKLERFKSARFKP